MKNLESKFIVKGELDKYVLKKYLEDEYMKAEDIILNYITKSNLEKIISIKKK